MQYNGSTTPFTPFRNVFVNGDMSVNQIQGVNQNTLVNCGIFNYIINNTDIFGIRSAGTLISSVNDSQQADHPILGAQGYSKSIVVTIAEGAVDPTGHVEIWGALEGNNLRNIWGLQCALSFWVKSPKTGPHYVTLSNSARTASFVAPYNVNFANTWEYKTISIVMNPGIGIFNFDTLTGLRINFPLVCGANFQTATTGTWIAGDFMAGINQQNLFDAIGNTFRVTDVQLEPGFVATPFDRLPFDRNFERCQRYYWQSFPYGSRPSQAGGTGNALQYRPVVAGAVFHGTTIIYPTSMAGAPAITTYNTNALNANWRNSTLGADSGVPFIDRDEFKMFIGNPQVIGDAVGNRLRLHFSVDAQLF